MKYNPLVITLMASQLLSSVSAFAQCTKKDDCFASIKVQLSSSSSSSSPVIQQLKEGANASPQDMDSVIKRWHEVSKGASLTTISSISRIGDKINFLKELYARIPEAVKDSNVEPADESANKGEGFSGVISVEKEIVDLTQANATTTTATSTTATSSTATTAASTASTMTSVPEPTATPTPTATSVPVPEPMVTTAATTTVAATASTSKTTATPTPTAVVAVLTTTSTTASTAQSTASTAAATPTGTPVPTSTATPLSITASNAGSPPNSSTTTDLVQAAMATISSWLSPLGSFFTVPGLPSNVDNSSHGVDTPGITSTTVPPSQSATIRTSRITSTATVHSVLNSSAANDTKPTNDPALKPCYPKDEPWNFAAFKTAVNKYKDQVIGSVVNEYNLMPLKVKIAIGGVVTAAVCVFAGRRYAPQLRELFAYEPKGFPIRKTVEKATNAVVDAAKSPDVKKVVEAAVDQSLTPKGKGKGKGKRN